MAGKPGNFGGRVTFDFDGIRIPPSPGEFKLDPSLFETSSEANQDGSAAYLHKPKLAGCDLEFRNTEDIDWHAMLLKQGNVTIVEETNGRTHLFTNARLVGKPVVNISTGVVSGLRVEGSQYQRI